MFEHLHRRTRRLPDIRILVAAIAGGVLGFAALLWALGWILARLHLLPAPRGPVEVTYELTPLAQPAGSGSTPAGRESRPR